MYFRRHIPCASRYLLKPHLSATCMTKLLRFGFEIGIPSAPITQKLKATTKTDENKLVISWTHRLRGARAGSTLREMLTQLPQPATVNISKWLPMFHLERCDSVARYLRN